MDRYFAQAIACGLTLALCLWVLSVVGAITIGKSPSPPPPAIVIQAQEIGVLYCPEGTQVYTSTEGVNGGFKAFCR